MSTGPSPMRLVSVNTVPERAAKVIGEFTSRASPKYDIKHIGNVTTIDEVQPYLRSFDPPPDMLFCASMWTPEQQAEIQRIAKETIPGIKTHGIPTGLHVKAGPEGIVQYLLDNVDSVMAQG